ncbi:MAG TPA: NPCBM/NEW2 domain-containing protein, partial [Bryobacteraceae bacterium]|nr:NPCBM/NEW2 domain-containing protein [Bryobacteraceae bacterium]
MFTPGTFLIPGHLYAQVLPKGSGNLEYKGFVRVIDGDTFEIYPNGDQVGIGTIGIKAPEGNTPCGKLAASLPKTLFPFRMSLKEDAKITYDKRRRRMYYLLTNDGRSLSKELVKAGLASPDGTGDEASDLDDLDKKAKSAGLGCTAAGMPNTATIANIERLTSPVAETPVRVGPGSLQTRAVTSSSATLAAGFSQTVVASGFTFPTNWVFLPDGRMLIIEKHGIIKVFKNGAVLPTPLMDISNLVNDYWDRGLIGVAADPNFASNGFIYLAYTYENDATQYSGPKTARLSRFSVVGDTASPASERVILGTLVGSTCDNFAIGADCLPSDGPTHSVGSVKFDASGNIFFTMGDGASFNVIAPDDFRGQHLDSLGGKLLHITPTGSGISTNPFWNGTASANRSKVWSLGLRNSYRMSLRPGTGIPYFGDVGWYTWEEVNVGNAGANLGWPCYEGVGQQSGYAPDPTCQSLYSLGTAGVQAPLYTYNHNNLSSAVTGGVFSTGTNYPAQFQGAYFFGDYAQSWLRYLRVDAANNLIGGPSDFLFGADGPVAIDQGPDGNLYYVSITKGELRKLTYVGGAPPPLTVVSVSPAAGSTGAAVSATVQATFSSLLDPSTVTGTTFTLSQQGTPVTATITYNGAGPTAILTPATSLQPSLTYTATVKGGASGVKDLSGNPLASDMVWSFTVVTVAPPPSGTSYVSALSPIFSANGWGPVEINMSNGENAAGDGGPISIRGTVYAKGLGVHAASDVRYNLGGSCSLFTATLGIDDEVATGPGTVVFQVWGDGVKLYESAVLRGTSAAVTTTVNVTARNQLQLVVTDAGDGNTSDHADWANAQITCGGPTGPVITNIIPASGATGVASNVTVSVVFAAGIDPTTLTPTTFTLVKQGTTTPLAATVSYNNTNTTGSLQPTSPLQVSTTYTATVKGGSGGVKDTAGIPLATDQVWSFTTSGASSGESYLSDLTPTSSVNGWGPVELDQSNGENAAGDGRTISIRGATFAKGLGVHAVSDVRYNLAGSCSLFSAVVGVDDEVPVGSGSIVFQVFGDGTKLFDSGVVTRASAAVPVSVNVAGKNQLELAVGDGGDGNSYDHGDWANAKVTCIPTGAPVPTITSPSSALLWKVGDVINYTGSAVDGSGAPIPAANLSWNIILHHCIALSCHIHPFTSSTGASGTFTTPDHGDNSYFEIALTAVDSAGRSSTVSLTLQPALVSIAFATTPSGLQVVYNGGVLTAPATVQTIVGSAHTIYAASPQSGLNFSSWSDGGAQQHDILAPASAVTLTASFGAPAISAVTASSITTSAATVTWTTDQASDSQVEYGTTTAYGASTTLNTTAVTSHSVALTGLSSGTLYHYRVKSKNAAGQLATSGDFTFTTSTSGAPVISAVTASAITTTGATVTWTTDQASDSQVEYGTTTAYGSSTTLNTTAVTSHSVALTGLTSGTLYHYRVKSKNAAGQLATSGDFTFTTSTSGAPVISAVTASAITTTGATVTWTTDQASDSQVDYGTTTAYGTSTTLNTTAVTSHSVALTGLTSGTLYHYRVKSKNAAGQLATSG